MKIRQGFVSNSSSSSFTCPVCEETFEGYDGEYGMDTVFTACGEMCKEHLGEFIRTKDLRSVFEKAQDASDRYENGEDDDLAAEAEEPEDYIAAGEELPEKFDPFYNLYYVSKDDILAYALKKLGTNREDLTKEIQASFKDITELRNYKG